MDNSNPAVKSEESPKVVSPMKLKLIKLASQPESNISLNDQDHSDHVPSPLLPPTHIAVSELVEPSGSKTPGFQ